MKSNFLAILGLLSAPVFAVDLKNVECRHHTDVNDDADMSVGFTNTDAEDIVQTTVSVLTKINNDHNWFKVFDGNTQVAWATKQVSIDSDDTRVSFQIELPIPEKSPRKPNAKLTFEGDREFSHFYCNQKSLK